MPTYDTPPSIDPITGRIPPYKQVLKQDATTGVWSTKYEYSVTPTTPTVNTETMGTGTYGGTTTTTGAGAATGAATNNTPFEENPLNTAFTQQGGEARQNERDRQEREANKFDPSTMSISQLQAVVNPSFTDRAVQTGASFLFPGIGLLTEVNKFRAQKELDKRMEEVQETYQSPEYREQSLEQERGGFIQSPQQKAMADRIMQDPMTGDASIAEEIAAQNRYQRSLERRLQNIEQERGGAIQSKNALMPGSVQKEMETAKLNAARRGGSRDKGEEASTQAFNQATSGLEYAGESRTSFEGTPQETTQTGTFSERRAKENEGRNKDGTAQPGSIAELRDIAATQVQPKAREVNRSNPVSNKAGRNEVGDRNGNAVTDRNGKAVNFGGKRKGKDKNGGSKNGGRVICSELYRQGLIPKEDWRLDLWYTQNYLSRKHIIGYWYYAIPMVKIMRKNKLVTNIWKHIAINRTQDIKWRLDTGKFNLLGRIYSIVLETTANILGHFVKEKDYTVLYKGEIQWQ
tara:strand:- start:517 stop:2070 length:1554 start_codon:yes stop_codon:yes gene_type:complete